MALGDPFKLEKLKIRSYSDRERRQLVSTFEAMFNPTTFSQDFEISYAPAQGIGSSATEARFTLSDPQKLQLELLLDGSGVDTIGVLSPFQKSVSDRVDEFLASAYELNGSTHEPNFLVVEWGDRLAFSCRLKKATVTYESFDRAGNPLRAKLVITVVSDATSESIAAQENLTSPDVTHFRVVRAGDTLPLLSKEIYGSPDHYLFVAAHNALDDFRHLEAGRELLFPPLETS